MKEIVPIALFAYSRPIHLQKTLRGLKRNNVPLIYAFSDGAKSMENKQAVKNVRKILREIDWCDINIVEQKHNLGLGSSIRNGVSRVLKDHNRLIVVEDDLVLRYGAYQYVVEALKHYEDNDDVMSISMWSHRSVTPFSKYSGFFSKRFMPWGWATYKTQWQKFDGNPLDLLKRCERENIDILSWGEDILWQVDHAAERDLWAVGFVLTHFLNRKVSYFPKESLVINIGRDGSGINIGRSREKEHFGLIDKSVCIPKNWPEVYVNSGLKKKFAYYNSRGHSFIYNFKRFIKIIIKKLIKFWQ